MKKEYQTPSCRVVMTPKKDFLHCSGDSLTSFQKAGFLDSGSFNGGANIDFSKWKW